MERKGDWIQTYTGVKFYPLDPRPDEIRLKDIAHALSLQCRYAGHCLQFYSVAEHCVRVSRAIAAVDAGGDVAAWGLMHDAAEAYLVDLPRPIKRYSQMGLLYREIEDGLMRAICWRFGLSQDEPGVVSHFDTVLLATEKRDLMGPSAPWQLGVDPLPEHIEPWLPVRAEEEFLLAAGRLLDGREHMEMPEVGRV